MGLEEEFGISVEEESAQSIATVQDAADLIEKLIEKKWGKGRIEVTFNQKRKRKSNIQPTLKVVFTVVMF